jgi:PhzF family phenazine biosynthesis protein
MRALSYLHYDVFTASRSPATSSPYAVTGDDLPVFLFAPPPAGVAATVYSRMFAPSQDPATGGASGPLGCYLVRYGLVPASSAQRIVSLQGVAMGRPSRVHVAIGGTPEAIAEVKVGGEAVLVAAVRSSFLLPPSS